MKLGEKQELIVVKKVEFGVYLATSQEEKENRILLPAKQVPEGCNVGDCIEVFVYRDSSDRMIATTKEPKLVMGQVAELTVAQIGKIGAFLDWGLEKDLFLPFKQQKRRVKQGEKVLVSLYIDKSNRLCATTNVYENLRSDSPYKKDDKVVGRVYEISDNFGAFVAVDNQYSALIPKKELYGNVALGEDVEARVIDVLPDGRLTLSIRERGLMQIEKDAQELLALLDSYSGVLPFTEKADPEVIRRETGMSKNEFKRAVGHLLKSGEIVMKDKVIRKA
ncbi:MAG: S1 RNA-binding domain-containing protein [Lachnospiraceae bacterium]|nr:S1 RNA-binding domain-containing protein [Lachnospiraceae bacterium]